VRRLVLISCVAVLFITGMISSPALADELSLMVYVIDCADVASGTLGTAEHAMTQAFGAAKIRTKWRDARTSPMPNVDPNQVTVVILSKEMSEQKAERDGISPYALATAAPAARRAWVFLNRVEEVARNQQVSVGTALGIVIAHEVAHVAAELPHTPRGIMSKELRVMADTFAGFSSEQGRQLTAAMRDAVNRPRANTQLALNRRSRDE
jgi:hypothetical protein